MNNELFSLCLSFSLFVSFCLYDHIQTACLMIKWTNTCAQQKTVPGSITSMCPDKFSHAGMSTSPCRRGSGGSGTPLSVCLSMKGKKRSDAAEAGDGCFPASSAHMSSSRLHDNVTPT